MSPRTARASPLRSFTRSCEHGAQALLTIGSYRPARPAAYAFAGKPANHRSSSSSVTVPGPSSLPSISGAGEPPASIELRAAARLEALDPRSHGHRPKRSGGRRALKWHGWLGLAAGRGARQRFAIPPGRHRCARPAGAPLDRLAGSRGRRSLQASTNSPVGCREKPAQQCPPDWRLSA
jgi:hypothetical protein